MQRIGAILGLLFLAACIRLPETGQRVLLLTSPQQENQLGEDGYREVLAKAKLNRDSRLNAILRRVGDRIAAQTQAAGFQWEYALIESQEQNAWCMPGGKIAVYTAILPIMADEAGMAAVLGHEVAHATLRHAGQRISEQMLVNLGLSLADVSLRNSQHHDMLLGLLGVGTTVGVTLPYSRGHETEADRIGLKYMARAGYDPRQALAFWQRFARSGSGAPPEFLSTHPGSATRIEDLQRWMPEALQLYQAAPQPLGAGERL